MAGKVLVRLAALTAVVSLSAQRRFTPLGVGSGWQIDDVYVDPFESR